MPNILKLILSALLLVATNAQAGQLAGEVRSVIGVAQLLSDNGEQRAITSGMQLHVGDTLQTTEGAHLHLRMVDDALLSLRPSSALKITGYTYQAGAPEQTNIRFDLLHGTVRSVTGKGGELAKDKFRMNTPVAAIGVRGTDFIAKADAETTLVNVQYGAIVLAPLGVGCQAEALGPCGTTVARLLNAEMSNMMLKFVRGTEEPNLVPIGEGLQIFPSPVVSGENNQKVSLSETPPTAPKSTSGSVSGALLVEAAATQDINSTLIQPTPTTPITGHYQMVWGRWFTNASSGDLGRTYQEASQGREVTVGNLTYGLFRENTQPVALPLSGKTQFTLREAQVTLTGSEVAGLVQNGELGVNFDNKTFNTQLNIQHPSLASVATLDAAGVMSSAGFFYSVNGVGNGSVKGSLSRNGTEAGYVFQLPTASGTIDGTTLWIK